MVMEVYVTEKGKWNEDAAGGVGELGLPAFAPQRWLTPFSIWQASDSERYPSVWRPF